MYLAAVFWLIIQLQNLQWDRFELHCLKNYNLISKKNTKDVKLENVLVPGVETR